jgi:hypothetical protein
VLTVEIAGELQGRHDDRKIRQYFNDHWRGWAELSGRIAQETMAQNGINLQTPERRNMPDSRPKQEVALMMKIRRRIETATGIPSGKFSITSIKARDIRHFTSKPTRKLIACNFCPKLRQKS